MIRSIAFALLAAGHAAFAQGGSAIINLVMPPPGGEGYTAALGMKFDAFDMTELEWETSLDRERGRKDTKRDPFRANPRMAFGIRKIESHDDGIREGQRAFYFAFSL
jgi:hypothetical protein